MSELIYELDANSIHIVSSFYSKLMILNVELVPGMTSDKRFDIEFLIDEVKEAVELFCHDNNIEEHEIFLTNYFFSVKSKIYAKLKNVFPEWYI